MAMATRLETAREYPLAVAGKSGEVPQAIGKLTFDLRE